MMRKLTFILIALTVFSCKKETTKPEPVAKLAEVQANGYYKHYYRNGVEIDGTVFNVYTGDSIRIYNYHQIAGTIGNPGYMNTIKIFIDGNEVVNSSVNKQEKTIKYTVK